MLGGREGEEKEKKEQRDGRGRHQRGSCTEPRQQQQTEEGQVQRGDPGDGEREIGGGQREG